TEGDRLTGTAGKAAPPAVPVTFSVTGEAWNDGAALRTTRMRLFASSAIIRLPAASIATPCGENKDEPAAGPPSPENPCAPLPTTVVMTPPGVTLRTRL